MASVVLGIVLSAVAAYLMLGVDGSTVVVNYKSVVNDKNNKPTYIVFVTTVASNYSQTHDADKLNTFVQKQLDKIQKNPEMFSVGDNFVDVESMTSHYPVPRDFKMVMSYMTNQTSITNVPPPTQTMTTSMLYLRFAKQY